MICIIPDNTFHIEGGEKGRRKPALLSLQHPDCPLHGMWIVDPNLFFFLPIKMDIDSQNYIFDTFTIRNPYLQISLP